MMHDTSHNIIYLSSCALVARSWVRCTQHHRFRTLNLNDLTRRSQRLRIFLELIRSPLCTIHNHVFEVDIDLFTLLELGILGLALLSHLNSIKLSGPPHWLHRDPSKPTWESYDRNGLPTLLASFEHLTNLEMCSVPFASLAELARLVGACSKLQQLSIRMACDLPLDSLTHPYIPLYFPPPTLRSLRILHKGVEPCDALYDWLSSAPEPLPIDTIVIQNFGNLGYTGSALKLLQNNSCSLENLAINSVWMSDEDECKWHISTCFGRSRAHIIVTDLPQPPLPDLNPYFQLQSFTCGWSIRLLQDGSKTQAADICRAMSQISSPCMRKVEIIIDMGTRKIDGLELETIDLYLQRPQFASLRSLTLSTEFIGSEMQGWARKTFPACFQRGIVKLREPSPQAWWS